MLQRRLARCRRLDGRADAGGGPRQCAFSTGKAGAALLPERHLGLVAAHELDDSPAAAGRSGRCPGRYTPLGQMTLEDLQRWAVDFPAPASHGCRACRCSQAVRWPWGVMRRSASSTLPTCNAWSGWRARVVFFSPLHDAVLPDCDAVWLPGGYPELHTAKIAANTGMQASLRAHVAAGKPLWAECGGMMALFESITLADGSTATLWGLLLGHVSMQKRLAALGPQQLTVAGHTRCAATPSTIRPATAMRPRGGPHGASRTRRLRGMRARRCTSRAASTRAISTHGFRPAPKPVAHLLGGVAVSSHTLYPITTELILGGQKSGKSRRAELLARDWLAQSSDHRAVLIATAPGLGRRNARAHRPPPT